MISMCAFFFFFFGWGGEAYSLDFVMGLSENCQNLCECEDEVNLQLRTYPPPLPLDSAVVRLESELVLFLNQS